METKNIETFNNQIFLTTTLPYVNSVPHIGHAFEFILADALSKHLKQSNDVHFNIGLDEHGLKVWTKSQELGITPQEHIANLTSLWKDFCEKFNIKYDSFYKTSDAEHHRKVQIVWQEFVKRGDIYKKAYQGKYCLGCESFKLDKELVDGKCKDHPSTDIKIVEEENYFFKLTNYKEQLLNWLDSNPGFLEPSNKIDELRNQLIDSEDISVSRLRQNSPWGVTVPNDDSQVIYVWFDALLNYIFAAGYLTDKFNWNDVIQLCGPDNLRFQGIIFQAFLASEGIKNTDKLLVHGTILDSDGRKISKTLGNVIDPIDQLEKYGVDAVRYYSLAGLNTWANSSWNEDELVQLWNSHIVNDWGNLLSRVLHLVDIKCDGNLTDVDDDFKSQVLGFQTEVKSLWDSFKIKEALSKTNEIVKFANKYINDYKPWSSDNYKQELSNLNYLLTVVNELYRPAINICDIVAVAIKNGKKQILFNKL